MNKKFTSIVSKKTIYVVVAVLLAFVTAHIAVSFQRVVYRASNPFDDRPSASEEAKNITEQYGLFYSKSFSSEDYENGCVDFYSAGTVKSEGIPFAHSYQVGGASCAPYTISMTNNTYMLVDAGLAALLVGALYYWLKDVSFKIEKRKKK